MEERLIRTKAVGGGRTSFSSVTEERDLNQVSVNSDHHVTVKMLPPRVTRWPSSIHIIIRRDYQVRVDQFVRLMQILYSCQCCADTTH